MSTTIFCHLLVIPPILKALRIHLSFGDRVIIDVRKGTGMASAGNEGKLFFGNFGHRWTMVLITSVLDKTLTARDLCRLYGERWGIETIYRELKAVAKIEQWHGQSVKLVRQELILLLVWFCFAAIFAADAEARHPTNTSSKIIWRANTRRVFEAITATIDALISETTKPPDVVAELLHRADSAIQNMCRWLLKRRPNRSYARVPMHPYARSITREE